MVDIYHLLKPYPIPGTFMNLYRLYNRKSTTRNKMLHFTVTVKTQKYWSINDMLQAIAF